MLRLSLAIMFLLAIELGACATDVSAHHDDVLTPHAIPITGDFDGDGQSDLGVYIDGWWYVVITQFDGGRPAILNFGGPTFQPVVADLDNDGTSDVGVFEPMTRAYYWLLSSHPGLALSCHHLGCVLMPYFPPAGTRWPTVLQTW